MVMYKDVNFYTLASLLFRKVGATLQCDHGLAMGSCTVGGSLNHIHLYSVYGGAQLSRGQTKFLLPVDVINSESHFSLY